ncbi:MFS transporter [Umezawaea sp. NPDC059074]|uniref:MFS transporter n=1 Tax=Umezawaea sp. NPDC059074 TaxID=3346716 RepID=UPI0036B2995C
MSSPATTPPLPVMTGRQKTILVLLLGAQFMVSADFSILNVAIPVIGNSLGFALENFQWIATAFALASAGTTLVFGRVADIAGRRKMLLLGMGLLVVASLVGGLASTPTLLLAARVAQGLATGIVIPAGMSLLTTSFPEGPLRDRALGLNGALLSAGFTVGAVLGGVLTGVASWRWAFLINVPVGLIVLLLAPAVLTESKAAVRTKIDVPGAVAVSLGLVALVFGISTLGARGWGDSTGLLSLAAAVVLFVAFVFIELRVESPLAPIRILTRSTVSWGNLGGLVSFTMETSAIFLMTLYLQEVLGYSALSAGLAFAVMGVTSFIGGIVAPRVIGRFGSPAALASGLLVQGVATAALFLVPPSTNGVVLVIVATSIGGFGHMIAIVGYMVTATSGLSNDEQGLATGLTSVTQQVGITIGIPIMSAIAASGIHTRTAEGASRGDAVLGGVTGAVLIDAIVVVVGAVVVGLFLRRSRVATPTP